MNNNKNNKKMQMQKSIEIILTECQHQPLPCKKKVVVKIETTSLPPITENNLNKIKEETILNINENNLTIVPNLGDGNCMFYSISTCLFGNTNKYAFIRYSVFEYYCTFDITKEYKSGGVEEKIKLLLMIEDEDEDEDDTHQKHSIAVQRNKEYGNIMDLYVISVLFNINIMTLNKFTTTDEDKYVIYPILAEPATPNQKTIYLKFTHAILHYEAIFINTVGLPPIGNLNKKKEEIERTPFHSRLRSLSLDNKIFTDKMSFSHILQHGRNREEKCRIIQPIRMHLRSSIFKLST